MNSMIQALCSAEVDMVYGARSRPTISPKTESALCKATWAGLGTLAGSVGGPIGAAAGAAGGTFLGETICPDPNVSKAKVEKKTTG